MRPAGTAFSAPAPHILSSRRPPPYGLMRRADGLNSTITSLGTAARPGGINNDGTVSGTGSTPAAGQLMRGFLRSAAGVYTRVDVPGIEGNTVRGINNAGQLVGSFDNHG